LAEAEPLMRRMVEIFPNLTRATGNPHPHLQTAAGNYVELLRAWEEARSKSWRRCLRWRLSSLGHRVGNVAQAALGRGLETDSRFGY
jgi:hypothetical protein